MIKILHIFSTFAVGGPQRRFVQIATGLQGYTHVVCAMDGDYAAAELMGEKIIKHPIDITKSGFISFRNLRALSKLLRDETPDLVCTYNWGSIEAVAALRLSGLNIPNLHFEDGFGPDETVDAQIKRRVVARRVLLSSAKVIVPSLTLQKQATDVWRLPAGKVTYIPNGVDTQHYYPAQDTKGGSVVIGAVGALRKEKNFSRLIRTFNESADVDAHLHIAGDGPERKKLEQLVAETGLAKRVRLTGHVEDPAGFYRACDIFMLTSDTEQMPLTVLEAMASGLPVIATDVGDIRQMVAKENANYIVPLAQENALPAVLDRLISNAGLRTQIGAANRAKAEKEFSQSLMLSAYNHIFREIGSRTP